MSVKSLIKKIIFGSGEIHEIKSGVAKGLKMKIDINGKTQRIIGVDELEIQKFFQKFSPSAHYFFDIGGSDGYYSLIFRKLNKSGQIYIFEAQERFKKEIHRNFSINGFAPDYTFDSRFVADTNTNNTVAIDSFFNEQSKNLLFKIDVDGGEVDVLKGLANTIRNNDCYFVIETHSLELENDCIFYLRNMGLDLLIIKHGWYRKFIPESRVIEHNRWLVASSSGKKK